MACFCKVHQEVDRLSRVQVQYRTKKSWAEKKPTETTQHAHNQTCQNHSPETCPHRVIVIIIVSMNENPIAVQIKPDDGARSGAMQKKMMLTSGDSDLVISYTLVLDMRRHGTSASTQTAQVVAGTSWQKALSQFTNTVSTQSSQENTISCKDS